MSSQHKFNIVLVFGAMFLFDSLVLPSLFGFREGVMSLVFLLALILNWGVVAPVLWLGSGLSLFVGFYWGLTPGSLVILFLLAALIYFFIASIFRVKKYVMAVILSVGLGFMFWHNMFAIAIMALAGFMMCFLLFDLCSEKKSIKFL